MVSLIILMIGFAANSAAIYDPNNIFCGSLNCYEVLGVSRESSAKDIKRVSLDFHYWAFFMSNIRPIERFLFPVTLTKAKTPMLQRTSE